MTNLELLQQRAHVFACIRHYFEQQQVLEVETPILSCAGNPDPYINSLTSQNSGQRYYLHTSPEFAMKRLLAAGSGSIYQICKVFREGESGRNHNPEFTMLEWYRVDYDYQQLMQEVITLVTHLLQQIGTITTLDYEQLSYQQACQQYGGFDPFDMTLDTLQQYVKQHALQVTGLATDDFHGWLDCLVSHQVTPYLGKDKLTLVYEYPAEQASLARLKPSNPTIAERFELYYQGIELANGFQELTDATQQRQRWQQQNQQRQKMQLPIMPLDERFLTALDHGFPECSGVALGIDRLLKLALHKTTLSEVMLFTLANA